MIFCPDLIDLLASIASASTVCSSAPTFWSSASICLRRHSESQNFVASCACAAECIAETTIAKTDPIAMQASKNFFMAGSALSLLDHSITHAFPRRNVFEGYGYCSFVSRKHSRQSQLSYSRKRDGIRQSNPVL